ncbi:MAG: HEAT repeat domain-containing protein, partial [bacterium]
YIEYRFNMRMMKEMYRLQKADELSGFAHDWFLPNKPIEELYDTKTDPDEVVNLADKPNHADKLKELRSALMDWQDSIADVCLMPEGELYAVQAAYNMPVTDFILQNKSYYKRIQTTANQSLYPKKNIDILIAALTDTIPSVRYWAIRGIGRLGANDKAYLPKLIALKNDPSHAVQVSLAWALSEMGNNTESLAIYRKLLRMKREEQPESDILHYNKMLAINDLTYNLYLAEKLKPELKQIASIKKYKLPLAAENVLKILETKNK